MEIPLKTVEDNLISKIINPKELIAYQNGAVVSRTIIKRKKGTVTIFAFDKGEGLSEHTAPFDAMVQVIDGESEIIIDGQPYLLSEGQMIIMPANIPHAVKAKNKFKMILTMIRETEE